MKEEKFLKLDVNPDVLPKEGTAVKLVIEVPARSDRGCKSATKSQSGKNRHREI